MANILFGRLGKNDCIIKNISEVRQGEQVFLDGETYEAVSIKHFPEGGKGVSVYKKIKEPFVRVLLNKIH